jgi:hypothetical protein
MKGIEMKTRKTIRVYLLAGLLLGGLACLFASCDDGVGNRASGTTVASNFSVSCLPFGADEETIARSSGPRRRMTETVEIPLEDRWILSATLEEEEVRTIRASSYDALVEGARFVVVAYEWDGAKLTFAPHGDLSKQHYQGVYFPWGGLVGVSAAYAFVNNMLTPAYGYYNGWKAETGVNAWYMWPGFTGRDFNGFPYVSTSFQEEYRNVDNLGSAFSANTGDICRYLSDEGLKVVAGKYRMPRSSEYRYGTQTGGVYHNTGREGYYWSSTGSSTKAYYFYFDGSNLQILSSGNRQYGYSVRCVLQ